MLNRIYFANAALRRSKKRVQAVISTELPFLIAKEFSVDKENNQHCVMNSYADMHRSRWNSIFDQMNKALCEEEKHLVSILYLSKKVQYLPSMSCSFFFLVPSYGWRLNIKGSPLKVSCCECFMWYWKLQQSWSNQVKEMQLHCEKGLQLFQWSTAGIEQMGAFVADSR